MDSIFLLLLGIFMSMYYGEAKEEITMPNAQAKVHDTYLCTAQKVSKDGFYITEFIPKSSKMVAHHMLLYGCTEPGDSEEKVWNCGEMAADGKVDEQWKKGPVCASGSRILYGWAMDAPKLQLPKDVGFHVGGDTELKYLVLQVHYKDPQPKPDSSGIQMVTTSKPQSKSAAVWLMGTGGNVPAHSVTYLEVACGYNDPMTLYPFAYRVHAHTHGKVNSGYRVRGDNWKEIGRKDPLLPEMFYNVTNPGMTIKPGDSLAARCTMKNDENRDVPIGSTQYDEMCNFYIMFYVEGSKLPPSLTCWSSGNLNVDGWSEKVSTKNVPADASTVPGQNEPLKQTESLDDSADSEESDEELDDFPFELHKGDDGFDFRADEDEDPEVDEDDSDEWLNHFN